MKIKYTHVYHYTGKTAYTISVSTNKLIKLLLAVLCS